MYRLLSQTIPLGEISDFIWSEKINGRVPALPPIRITKLGYGRNLGLSCLEIHAPRWGTQRERSYYPITFVAKF